MEPETNTSFDSNHGSTNDKQEARKLQFTTKQRMDMYAFCVLELELHGNTVSIKKQQQAIQKALKKENGQSDKSVICLPASSSVSNSNGVVVAGDHLKQFDQQDRLQSNHNQDGQQPGMNNNHPTCHNQMNIANNQSETLNSSSEHLQQANSLPSSIDGHVKHFNEIARQQQGDMEVVCLNGDKNLSAKGGEAAQKMTLLQLQEEISKTQRCYSDYQKTQVLTTSMLREVQRRFAKYYPDTHCPSRTTIKSVFIKCVENGTVENVKNPRKPTKIPNGDQIEQFLVEEPQMSLREMAKKLNVSTGTVSRRCRALGIIPESVTLKHQQMAIAKRQKQMKQSMGKTKNSSKKTTSGPSRQQQATLNHQEQTQYTNGLV